MAATRTTAKSSATKPATAKAAAPKSAAKPAVKTAAVTKRPAAPKKPAAPRAVASAHVDEAGPSTVPEAVGDLSNIGTVVASAAHDAQEVVTLKFRQLVEQVTKATGAKKKGVKEIVEATLQHLGDALWKGHHLNLPPLGKARVGRHKDTEGGEVLMVKLHRGGAKGGGKKAAKEPLADAEE